MSSETFDEFYGETSHRTLRFAYAMCGDHGVAQDLTQEAYVRAWQRWSQLVDYDHPESWLRLVVTRMVKDRWRWLSVRRNATVRIAGSMSVPPPSEDAVVIQDALRRLPVRHRQAIVMYYLMDMPIAEIADETGVAVGTVKPWLSRGRDELAIAMGVPAPQGRADELRQAGDRRTRHRRAAAVSISAALVAVLVAVLIVLGHNHLPPTPIGPTPSEAPPATSTPSSAPRLAGAACRPSDLDPRPYYRAQGASGRAWTDVMVQNISSTECHLAGFPQIEALDVNTGRVVTPPFEHLGDAKPVVLQPGMFATFDISHMNGNLFEPGASQCATPRAYRQMVIVFDGTRYPLPGLAMSWECNDGFIRPWRLLDLPFASLGPEVTRAP